MPDIHIVAPFIDANGGDWRAIDLYLGLSKENNVQLWSPHIPNKELLTLYPIHEIKPYDGKLPNSGILYVVGSSTVIGHWYDQVKFEKVIVIHNLFTSEVLYKSLNRLTLDGTREVEIQYASNMVKDTIGLSGEIAYPFPHPARFRTSQRTITNRKFTVGRVSRDVINKHHFSDPNFYLKLTTHNIDIKIIGGTCLRSWLEHDENIILRGEISHQNIPQILNTLDCFYYRTSIGWKEAFGIVVVEAMLCGLPVVCYRQGGYAEIIKHGENGFLFDNEEEALEIILNLKGDPDLRLAIGQKARQIC